MPYKSKAHATAAFLNIKRREGLAAAKAFGEKHKEDLSGSTSYTPRSKRVSARKADVGDAAQGNSTSEAHRRYRGRSDAAQGNSTSEASRRRARRRRRSRGFTLSEGVNQANKRS